MLDTKVSQIHDVQTRMLHTAPISISESAPLRSHGADQQSRCSSNYPSTSAADLTNYDADDVESLLSSLEGGHSLSGEASIPLTPGNPAPIQSIQYPIIPTATPQDAPLNMPSTLPLPPSMMLNLPTPQAAAPFIPTPPSQAMMPPPKNFSMKERSRVEKWVNDGFSEFLQPKEIRVKYNFISPMSWENWRKFGLQLAKSHFFGERLLSLSSLGGRDDLLLLNLGKIDSLKETLLRYAPQNSSPSSIEANWTKVREKIGNLCKRCRRSLVQFNMKEKAEFLAGMYTNQQ